MPSDQTKMMNLAQRQANAAVSLGQVPGGWQSGKRDEYANSIVVERREHDAVLRFYCRGDEYSSLVREITVPLGALEGLT